MNEKQFAALKTALQDPKFSGLTDQQAYDLLTTPVRDFTRSRTVTVNDFLIGVAGSGAILNALETESLSDPFWKWAVHALKTTGLDFSDGKVLAQVNTLESGGKLTAVQANRIKDLVATTEAEALGIFHLQLYHVVNARS